VIERREAPGPDRAVGWRRRLTTAAITAVAIAGAGVLVAPAAQAATCTSSTMYVSAHQDDALLFMSPDLLRDASAPGACVQTVFVTAGDAGRAESYWSSREAGTRAAYATMLGVANAWVDDVRTVAGRAVRVSTLAADDGISLVFLRLPEGAGTAGDGSALYGYQSIKKLWDGTISSTTTVDGTATYTLQGLQDTLLALMVAAQPTRIGTHDYAGSVGGPDNPDHYVTGYLTRAAHLRYSTPHHLDAYQGYGVLDAPANVVGAELTTKTAAFYAYTPFDSLICQTPTKCASRSESAWLQRQYVVASEDAPLAPTDPGGSANVARTAVVSVSSQDTAAGQGAVKAIDGVVAGYPDAPFNEWSTVKGKVGTWIALTWATPQTLSSIVLDDRPNLVDQATAGVLTFSDGSTMSVGALPNDGSPLRVTFSPRAVTSVRYTVTSVLKGTANLGLAEIEAWTAGSTPPPVVTSPVAAAGADQQVASGAVVSVSGSASTPGTGGALGYAWSQVSGPAVTLSSPTAAATSFTAPTGPATVVLALTVSNAAGSATDQVSVQVAAPPVVTSPVAAAGADQQVASGAVVSVDGSASTPGTGGALGYAWSQVSGPAVTLSSPTAAATSFTAPTGPATVVLALTVSNAAGSATDQVSVQVAAPPPPDPDPQAPVNVAPAATVTASSQDTAAGQGAAKAVDGVAAGYPSAPLNEWSSVKGKVGTWITLTWSTPQTLTSVVLYDRPNLVDQVTAGTLTFSDGSQVAVKALPNDGTVLTVTFSARTVTSVRFTATKVLSGTQNIGLAEFEAWTP